MKRALVIFIVVLFILPVAVKTFVNIVEIVAHMAEKAYKKSRDTYTIENCANKYLEHLNSFRPKT